MCYSTSEYAVLEYAVPEYAVPEYNVPCMINFRCLTIITKNQSGYVIME